MFKRVAVAVSLMFASVSTATAAYYLNQSAWEAALPTGTVVVPFPEAIMIGTDSYGSDTWISSAFGSPFTCHAAFFPCLGVFNLNYALPFDILGISGELNIYRVYGSDNFNPFVTSPMSLPSNICFTSARNCYQGFYGALFEPTNHLSIDWPEGHQSRDAYLVIELKNASVVRVPESTTLVIFGAGLLGLMTLSRRRTAWPDLGEPRFFLSATSSR